MPLSHAPQVINFIELALTVIETEAQAIAQLAQRLDANFTQACHYLLNCKARIIVTGMGKSSHIGQKIASTLASTGTPAFFVHAGEAGHGDMGMVTREDVVLAVSNSGHTEEILILIPMIKRLAIPLIALTGNPKSPLAQAATINIDISVPTEACPLGLAPTSSATAALVMGDALAIALLTARGFSKDDFALSHPGGNLGRRLLLKVQDIMHAGSSLPEVNTHTFLADALLEITEKRLGMTTVTDDKHRLAGIFTDGDLRRAISRNIDIHTTPIHTVMTKHSKAITANTLAVEALNLMEKHKITSLVVIDEKNSPLGVVHMHDILQSGVV